MAKVTQSLNQLQLSQMKNLNEWLKYLWNNPFPKWDTIFMIWSQISNWKRHWEWTPYQKESASINSNETAHGLFRRALTSIRADHNKLPLPPSLSK